MVIRGNEGILKAFSSRNTINTKYTKKDFVFQSDLGYNGRKCQTPGLEITTLGYVCLRLKIVSSSLPRSLPFWRKKPSPHSEFPELNACVSRLKPGLPVSDLWSPLRRQ